MRYYAGNWDTTLWCVKPSAGEKIDNNIVSIASMPQAQMERYYGSPETAQMYLYMGYAFRAFNTHGRAMFTLAHRAMAGQNEDDYVADRRRADLFDGHRLELRRWPHAQRAIDRRDAGAVPLRTGRGAVVLLDAQPIHRQTQQYRLVDAATGEFESGYVKVADMVTRQPWDDNVPVHVLP